MPPPRTRSRPHAPLVSVSLVVGALIASCGTDDGGDAVTSSPPADARAIAIDAGAELFDVDASDVEAGEPVVLNPSACTVVRVWRAGEPGAFGRGVAVLPDGSTIAGGTDDAFGEVAAACFADEPPDAETAARLAVATASMPGPVVLLDEADGPRRLERVGATWQPPTLVESEDGFSVTFLVFDPETSLVDRVTSTVAGGVGSTTSEPVG